LHERLQTWSTLGVGGSFYVGDKRINYGVH